MSTTLNSTALNDIFGANGTQITMPTTESGASNEFRPNYKKGTAGVYQAVIRFLPNPADPSGKSIIRKRVTNLLDPYTNTNHYVDNPSSVGKPDILQSTFFALRNSEDAIKKEQSKMFSSRERFTSLIQVLNDPHRPETNNKILVWNYGIKVFEKLQAEMTAMPGAAPRNPFDLINGRAFLVKVKEKSGFPNFDECMFYDIQGGSSFRVGVKDSAGNEVFQAISNETIASQEGKMYVFNYLNDNAPDMAAYEYHEWDQETTNLVNKVINYYMHPELRSQMAPATPQQPVAPAAAQPNSFNLPNMSIPQPVAPATPQQPVAPAAAMPQMQVSGPAIPGLQMGMDSVNTESQSFAGSDIPQMPNLGSSTPAETAESTTAPGAMNLDDILNQQFV